MLSRKKAGQQPVADTRRASVNEPNRRCTDYMTIPASGQGARSPGHPFPVTHTVLHAPWGRAGYWRGSGSWRSRSHNERFCHRHRTHSSNTICRAAHWPAFSVNPSLNRPDDHIIGHQRVEKFPEFTFIEYPEDHDDVPSRKIIGPRVFMSSYT